MSKMKVEVIPWQCHTTDLRMKQKGTAATPVQRSASAILFCQIREKGKPPIVMFPGECYYCGACVMVCPKKGALRLQHPVMNRAKFVPVKPEPEN